VSSAPIKSPSAKPTAAADPADQTGCGAPSLGLQAPLPLNRYAVYLLLAVVGAAADLLSKQAIFDWLGVAAPFIAGDDPAGLVRWRGDEQLDHLWWLWEGRLGIQTSINTGALFGMGAGRWWLFAGLSVLALLGILTWLFVYKAAHDRWLNVALGFVSGGILGNLYDRLGLWNNAGLRPEFQHGVRDWILFVWPESKLAIFNPWPNFNIADSLLVTGAIMLVVHALVWREPAPQQAASTSPD
jgi:signal peptidase II